MGQYLGQRSEQPSALDSAWLVPRETLEERERREALLSEPLRPAAAEPPPEPPTRES